MRIVVVGGGVVGVSTAYQLQVDGHEVVVLEQLGEVAAGASWGNAGMIAPGHSFVWSSPKAPMTLARSLVLRNQALRFRFSADLDLYRWSVKFLGQCTPAKARRNTLLKHLLATYSQKILDQVVRDEGLSYARETKGILYFHRNAQSLERGIAQMGLLERAGQKIEIVDAAGVARLDPALARGGPDIVGGILCATDETGDPARFTRALAEKVVARGGEIVTHAKVTNVETSADRVVGLRTQHGLYRGDLYVLATGHMSGKLTKGLGIGLPVYPIKGYSLTIPIAGRPGPPEIASVDEANLVAISRFDDRVRVTATAEFAGFDDSHRPSDFAFMRRIVQGLYPDGGDYDAATMWAGLRPMTPDNLPHFGRRRFANLFVNTGHGHIGWTMAHGSARITADLIAGRRPALPTDGLHLH